VIPIDAHAGGGDAEHHRGAAIEKRVERDQDVLGLIDIVATAQRRLDTAVLAVHPRADVEHIVVKDDPHVHRIGRRRALDRLFLDEIGDRRCLLPHLVIETAVDANRSVGHTSSGRLLAIAGAVDGRLRLRGRRKHQYAAEAQRRRAEGARRAFGRAATNEDDSE
jgi:hypothetical protein